MSKSKHHRIHRCVCAACRQHPRSQIAQQHKAINRVLVTLNEKNRRHFVGLLAMQWGARNIALLSHITGLSRTTVHRGKREVEHPGPQANRTFVNPVLVASQSKKTTRHSGSDR